MKWPSSAVSLNIWKRTFHFKDLIILFWALQTLALFANKAQFLSHLSVVLDMFSPKWSRWPPIILPLWHNYTVHATEVKVSERNQRWKIFTWMSSEFDRHPQSNHNQHWSTLHQHLGWISVTSWLIISWFMSQWSVECWQTLSCVDHVLIKMLIECLLR